MRLVETHAAESGSTTLRAINGYGPSWLDFVAQWVRRLPVPAWAFWIALWLGLLLLGESAKWRDGSLALGVIHPLHAVFNAVTVYMLAVCPVLDRVALRALAQTRPALDVTDAEYERWEYALTTTPARPMVVANVIGLLAFGAGLAVFLDPTTFELTEFNPSSVLDLIAVGANAVALSAFLYHTIHQLRRVRAVVASHLKVDLLQTGPLRSFSVLTALTATALIVANYTMLGALVAASPVVALSPLSLAVTATTSLLAIIVFAWPLLDLSARMRAEKQRILNENADELRASFAERRRLIENNQLERVAALKDAVDVLVIERAIAEKLPSLPWHASIARGLGTTLVLPIVLIIVQGFLERVLG